MRLAPVPESSDSNLDSNLDAGIATHAISPDSSYTSSRHPSGPFAAAAAVASNPIDIVSSSQNSKYTGGSPHSGGSFAALVGRVEREHSDAVSSVDSTGSGHRKSSVVPSMSVASQYHGSMGGIDASRKNSGSRNTSRRPSRLSGGIASSGPSWTSSDTSSFTVGLERLSEKLRARPSSGSGGGYVVPHEEEEQAVKTRLRIKRKLRRTNSLPLPSTSAIPELAISASSSGDSSGGHSEEEDARHVVVQH